MEGLAPGTYAMTVVAFPTSSSSNLSAMQTTTAIVTLTDEPEQEVVLSF